MPAVPSWMAPYQFDLTNPYNGTLSFNVQTASGLYLLMDDGCDFQINVRSTKSNVPQADGSILHHRFLTGVEIPMTVQLWEDSSPNECDPELLAVMLDNLTGALRSLLNAGDNEGRLAWEVAGQQDRMVDDVRLLVYPTFDPGPPATVTFTLDSQFPYAQDLVQTCTVIADGTTEIITNDGSADYDPVFLVNVVNCDRDPDAAAVSDFLIENLTTGMQFAYTDTLPGAVPISAGGHWAEINTFLNTIYLDGDSTNLKAGVIELESEYFPLRVGDNEIGIEGCDMVVLHAPAWG